MKSLRRAGLASAVVCGLLVGWGGCTDGNTGYGAHGPTGSSTSGGNTTCASATECKGGLVCIVGKCAASGSVMAGAPCSASRDCQSGLACTEVGLCGPAGKGKAGDTCSGIGDCSAGLSCVLSGLSGVCAMGGTGDLGASCKAPTDCLAGLVCSPVGTCDSVLNAFPPFAGVVCAADAPPFRAFWEVPRPSKTLEDFYRLPFPNDARVKADGTLDLSDFPRPGPSILGVDIVDLYATALSQDFDGFASVSAVTFRFSQDLDLSSVSSNVHYVDVTDPVAADFGADRAIFYSYTIQKGKYVCQHPLTITNAPTDPLKPGHAYAVYFTTAVKGMDGSAASIDPDLAAVLGAAQPGDATLGATWTKYANFRAYLAKTSIAASTIAGASVITIADPTAKAKKLAAATIANGLPQLTDLTLCDGNTTSPCAGAGDRQCGNSSGSFWEIHGRFTEPNFQAGTPPYATPPDGGGISYDGSGNPAKTGSLSICFALTVPKSAMPAAGWPLLVHAHGTGGSFRDGISSGIASTVSTGTAPLATLTYEGIEHGARNAMSTRPVDTLVFNVVNPRAARDNHAQGAVDVVQALQIAHVAPFSVPSAGSISFDPSKLYFFGHSQGSTVGIPGVALSTDAKAAIFSGAGSYLTDAILTKTSPSSAQAGLSILLGESIGEYHPVMGLWQTFFDRIDPLNYDRLLVLAPPPGVPSKHVLLTWSATDTYSPKATLTDTAQVMGLVQAPPVLEAIQPLTVRPVTNTVMAGDGATRTAAVFQYATDGTYDGHFVSTMNPMAVADWSAFLSSLASTGTPMVP